MSSANTCALRQRTEVAENATMQTLTDSDPARIFPQEIASSGRAPESEPSNSCPVFWPGISSVNSSGTGGYLALTIYTEKSAPFRCWPLVSTRSDVRLEERIQ